MENTKKFDRVPKFAVGDVIKHPKHGIGVIKQVDNNNYDFFYYADFCGRGGDNTKAWLPKIWSEKNCTVIKKSH